MLGCDQALWIDSMFLSSHLGGGGGGGGGLVIYQNWQQVAWYQPYGFHVHWGKYWLLPWEAAGWREPCVIKGVMS